MLTDDKDKKYAIQAVENALDVLEALSNSPEEFRLPHLMQRLSLSKMTLFRLLATFERRGYIEKITTGQYRIGASAAEVGQKLLLRLSLLQKAKPVMENLAWKCNEAVYLGIRKGTDVLLIEMVDSFDQVKVVPLLGHRYPLESVAAGKVLTTEPHANQRPSSAPAYAIDCGDLGSGVVSLAVPLRNGSGRICASLCIVGPEYRLGEERIARELRPCLIEAGEVVSSRLGYFDLTMNREGEKKGSFRQGANSVTPARGERSAIIL